jgi:hypothetical protein
MPAQHPVGCRLVEQDRRTGGALRRSSMLRQTQKKNRLKINKINALQEVSCR